MYLFKKQKVMYVIIKNVKFKSTGRILPVILLNQENEVWEFEKEKEAQKMADIFNHNSDSGHFYYIKKV